MPGCEQIQRKRSISRRGNRTSSHSYNTRPFLIRSSLAIKGRRMRRRPMRIRVGSSKCDVRVQCVPAQGSVWVRG